MTYAWFRMYTEAVDDEKLRLLAFEDRWHFVALLCCKSQGLLDTSDDPTLRQRKIAVKLGLQTRELEEVARRLSEVGLIDKDTLQPLAWDKRQYISDRSTDRVARHRERKKQAGNDMKQACNVTVTPPDTDTDTDTDTEKDKPTRARARANRFMPPTVTEVREYCIERCNGIDATAFIDHYTANGWKVGRNQMRDWKAAVRTWEKRHAEDQRNSPRAKTFDEKLAHLRRLSGEG